MQMQEVWAGRADPVEKVHESTCQLQLISHHVRCSLAQHKLASIHDKHTQQCQCPGLIASKELIAQSYSACDALLSTRASIRLTWNSCGGIILPDSTSAGVMIWPPNTLVFAPEFSWMRAPAGQHCCQSTLATV